MSPAMSEVVHFLNELMGSYLKVREIHWNTYGGTEHTVADDTMDEIIEYVDQIAESAIGVDDRPGFDIFNVIIPNSTDLTEIIQVLLNKAERLKNMLTMPIYNGVVNALDDFTTDFSKLKYRSTLR